MMNISAQKDLAVKDLTPGPSPEREGGKSLGPYRLLYLLKRLLKKCDKVVELVETIGVDQPADTSTDSVSLLRSKVVTHLEYFVNYLPKRWDEAFKSPVSGDLGGYVGRILCTAAFIAFLFMAPVRGQNAKELAKEIMDSYASHLEPVDALRKMKEADADKMVDAFMQYVAAPEAEVRRTALNMIHRVASRRGDAGLQKQVVRLLIRSLDDSESTIVNQAVGYLAQYPPEVFDSESRYLLTQRAKEKKRAQNKVVMLTGYLGITELTYNYRQMLNDEKIKDKRLRLSLQLAMVRLGDTTALRELLVLAKKVPVGDDFVYDFVPNLAYTCQKEVYNLMFDIILSDSKNCFSSNPDSEKPIICAYRVIETIAPYIKDFPVTFDNTGEVDITDYPATLAKVREWIKSNRDKVEFIRRY